MREISSLAVRAKYLKFIIFHPFDGFFEAKNRGKGSSLLAAIILLLYGVTGIFSVQYRGFIDNFTHTYGLDSVELFLASIMPVVLFIVSNWSMTTLMNGNGRFRDIFLVVCYSLVPLIIFSFITTLVSNIIILEELPIVVAFDYIGKIWFAFILFCGLCTVHEYTALKNIGTLLLTFFAAVIIMFICVLFLTLIDNVLIFINIVSTEITKSW